ncbi:MAG: hypothetical protein JXR56_02485, partial [Candidatus Cloacimonetes bacterium]|nr:hypothetical protein [Candidatus Cloacimonadota bacterium]
MKKTSQILILLLMLQVSLSAHSRSISLDRHDSKGIVRLSRAIPPGNTNAKSDTRSTGGIINNSGDLVIQSGAYLIITGGDYESSGTGFIADNGSLRLTGDFINNNSSGTPVSESSNVDFIGSTQQSISGTAFSFGNVVFDNPSGVSIDCDVLIGGNLTATDGLISMTDYDFGVSGTVIGSPEIVVTGTGAVGNVGNNATITVDSPNPTGLPLTMNTLVVNPGAGLTYQLPNSTSVVNLNFTSGSLGFGSHALGLTGRDIDLSGAGTVSSLLLTLRSEVGTYGSSTSINKIWNLTGNTNGSVSFTLHW